MGGCNSVLNDVELAGVFVGAGVAEFASGGAATAGAIGAMGAAGAYFATKKGCGRTKEALIRSVNEITTVAIMRSFTNCSDAEYSDQVINVTCQPDLFGGVYESNVACGNCTENVMEGMLAQHKLERSMWKSRESTRVRLPIDQEFGLIMARMGSCGISTCKACNLTNVTQVSMLRGNSGCINSGNVQENFKSNLTSLVKQQLTNNQDVLAGVATAFSKSNVSKLSEDIYNRIQTTVTSNFLSQIRTKLNSSQVITVNSGGSSSLNNIDQYSALAIVAEQVTSENVATKSFSQALFTFIEKMANEQNTLNDVGELVFKSSLTFVDAVGGSVGKVMLAVLITLGALVLFIIGFAIYRGVKQSVTRRMVKQDLNRLQTKPAF